MKKRSKRRSKKRSNKKSQRKIVTRLRDDVKELISTNWISELVKAFVVSILTITVLFMIKLCSPGDFEGDKLLSRLKDLVESELSRKTEVISLEQIYIGPISALDEDEVIMCCGTYKDEKTLQYRRFFVIYETKNRSLLNEIIETSPAYEITYLRCTDYDISPEYIDEALLFDNVSILDCDNDFYYDFIFSFSWRFATREAQISAILRKSSDGWSFSSPDMSIIQDMIDNTSEIKCDALYDEFNLICPDGTYSAESLIGITHGGNIIYMNEPFWGDPCFLYAIATYDGKNGLLSPHEYALFMLVYKNGSYKIANNWNSGMPLYSGDIDDSLDIKEVVDSYWGFIIDGNVGYGAP